MDIRYYHEFKGQDNILNRFEILTGSLVQAVEVKARADAFSIEYPEVRKLDPVRGSQATMSLISESVFQFVDLHTDDMRGYLVKFYRSGSLLWGGIIRSPAIRGDVQGFGFQYNGAIEILRRFGEQVRRYRAALLAYQALPRSPRAPFPKVVYRLYHEGGGYHVALDGDRVA